jgi:hypothetical protein
MKQKLIALFAVLVLMLPLVACSPTTTLQLIQVAVSTFVAAEQADHGGNWAYAQLTTDTDSLVTGWNADTTAQKIAAANVVTSDITNTPFCDAKCKIYVPVAVAGIDAAIIILQPSGALTMTTEKDRVATAYANYRTKWNAVSPKKAKLK